MHQLIDASTGQVVVMLNDQGVALAVHHDIRPWRAVAGARETRSILEVPAGSPPDRHAVGSQNVERLMGRRFVRRGGE